MPPATTRPRARPTLYVAFELGNTEWKLAMTTSIEQAPLVRTMPSRELETQQPGSGVMRPHSEYEIVHEHSRNKARSTPEMELKIRKAVQNR